MHTANFVNLLTGIPILLATGTGIWYFKRYPKPLKVLAVILILFVFVQILLSLLGSMNMQLGFPLHIHTLFNGLLAFYFYWLVLQNYFSFKTFVIWCFCYAILLILNMLILEPINAINPYANGFLSILIVILSFFIFSVLLNEKHNLKHESHVQAIFWATSGFFITNSCFILTVSFSTDILNISTQYQTQMGLWIFHSIYVTIGFTCYFISFLKCLRKD